jgi:hypothetical protein
LRRTVIACSITITTIAPAERRGAEGVGAITEAPEGTVGTWKTLLYQMHPKVSIKNLF